MPCSCSDRWLDLETWEREVSVTCRSVKMEGTVLFNDAKLTKGVKKRLGYVLQDDLLYVSLTPYDSLYYAAMLRLPATMSKAEKLERVEAVITTLGLTR